MDIPQDVCMELMKFDEKHGALLPGPGRPDKTLPVAEQGLWRMI